MTEKQKRRLKCKLCSEKNASGMLLSYDNAVYAKVCARCVLDIIKHTINLATKAKDIFTEEK